MSELKFPSQAVPLTTVPLDTPLMTSSGDVLGSVTVGQVSDIAAANVGDAVKIVGGVLPPIGEASKTAMVLQGTYTFTGQPPIIIPSGKIAKLLGDSTTKKWTVESEDSLPVQDLSDYTKKDDVIDIIDGENVMDLFPSANLPVRRYTSDTAFTDYANGYSQEASPDGLRMSIPSSGSAGVSFWINTGLKANVIEFTFKPLVLQTTGFIGFGFKTSTGNYIGYMLSKTGVLRIINNFSTALLQNTTAIYDVGDIVKLKVENGFLKIFKNNVESFSIAITNNFDGEICAVQQGFHSYSFKINYLVDPVGYRIDNHPSKIDKWEAKFYEKGSQVIHNMIWYENNVDATSTDIPNGNSLIWSKVITSENLLVASKNIFDKSKVIRGFFNDSGVFTSSTNSICLPLQDIDQTKGNISINQNPTTGTAGRIFFYNQAGGLISKVDKPTTQNIPIPVGTVKYALNIYSVTGGVPDPTNNSIVNSLQVEHSVESTSYAPFGDRIDEKYLPAASSSSFGVEMYIESATKFNLNTIHQDGQSVTHAWQFNQLNPDSDWGWYSPSIIHEGNVVVQGSFNWIYMTLFPNENMHVGIGHGCEKQTRCDFYIDGKKIDIDANIGKTIKGSIFTFDFSSDVFAVDASLATGNGVSYPKVPLLLTTKHYMMGGIKSSAKRSQTWYNNQLTIYRGEGTGSDLFGFNRCYSSMHLAYPEYFDRIELHNCENTQNAVNPLGEPRFSVISPSTAVITNGGVYSTVDGFRAEVGTGATSYSSSKGYIFNTKVWAQNPQQQEEMNILAAGTAKLYFNQVITPVTATPRGLTVSRFKKGDVLKCYVERELIIK